MFTVLWHVAVEAEVLVTDGDIMAVVSSGGDCKFLRNCFLKIDTFRKKLKFWDNKT